MKKAARLHTVLLVQGDAAERQTTAELLRCSGFRVLTAVSAGQARHLLTELPGLVSVILSDVSGLGDMTGFELADWTRAHWLRIATVLVTAGHDRVPPRQGYFVVQKPYSMSDVVPLIRLLQPGPV